MTDYTPKPKPIETGGPAFPCEVEDFLPSMPGASIGAMVRSPLTGMTQRDWFAGQALAGMLANPQFGDKNIYDQPLPTYAAHAAYAYADAMLQQRNHHTP